MDWMSLTATLLILCFHYCYSEPKNWKDRSLVKAMFFKQHHPRHLRPINVMEDEKWLAAISKAYPGTESAGRLDADETHPFVLSCACVTMAKKKPNKLVLSSAYIYSFHIKFLSSLKWRATDLEKKSTFWFKPQLSSMFCLDFMKINIYLVKIRYNIKSCIFCKAACNYAN